MKHHYFRSCLALQLRLAAKKLPALLSMVLAILLLSAAAALGAAGLLGSQRFAHPTIAITSEDEDPRLDPLIRMVGNVPEISTFAQVVQVPPHQAANLVASGEAAAALVLPAGFLNSVFTGENITPRLIVDSSRPVETALLTKLAASTIRVLTASQQGVSYTLKIVDTVAPGTARRGSIIEGINYRLFQWVLGNGEMYRHIVVNPGGQLSVLQMYLLGSALFFLLLATPMLYRLLSLYAAQGWARRLRAAGCPLVYYTAAQLIGGTLLLLPPLALLLTGVGLVGGQGAPVQLAPLLGAALLCAFFLSCLSYLLCNIGSVIAAVGINFLFSAAVLVLSGGLIPLALLPAPLAALAPYSPLTWMRSCLSSLYGVSPSSLSFLLLAGAAVLLLVLCLLRSAQLERRHAA